MNRQSPDQQPMDCLPDELVLRIILMSESVREVAALASTCWRMAAMVRDDATWRELCLSHYGPPAHAHYLARGKSWYWLYRAQACPAITGCALPSVGAYVRASDASYWGDLVDGRPHGYGAYVDVTPVPGPRARRTGRTRGEKFALVCEGQFERGDQCGWGCSATDDGTRYEGDWLHDKMHGRGTSVRADGTWYEGEWKDGRPHGRGTLAYSDGSLYKGEWKDGKGHRQGGIFSDGRQYEGEWKDGQRCGQGVQTYGDGRQYNGGWKQGKKHGRGVLTYLDGDRIEATWHEGRELIETSTYTWGGTGDSYSGKWKDGDPHGRGVMTWPSGERYEGDFVDGKVRGQGTHTDADGVRTETEWDGAQPGSSCTQRYPDGSTYMGPCRLNEGQRRRYVPHGRGVVAYLDGSQWQSDWAEGLRLNRGVVVDHGAAAAPGGLATCGCMACQRLCTC